MPKRIVAIACLVTIPVASQAESVNPWDMMTIQRACRADVEQLCGHVERGSGQLRQCLSDKASQMSPGCTETLMRYREQFQMMDSETPAGN